MFVARKKEKGITLVSLVVTVIVLLILAGISISAITGGNGVIDQTIDARNATEINAEIKTIQMASTNSRTKSDDDSIKTENLEEELNNAVGEGKTSVDAFGDEKGYIQFAITFLDSGRVYALNEDSDDIEYIGTKSEGSNRGFLIANPKKDDKPKRGAQVEVSLMAFSDSTISSMEYSWSNDKHEALEYQSINIESGGNDVVSGGEENSSRRVVAKIVKIDYPSKDGTYYLHVKAKITKNGKEKDIYNVFGRYKVGGDPVSNGQYAITYKMGDNVIYIGSTYEIVTEGKTYLPSITAKYGFSAKGWYEGSELVGLEGQEITVDRDMVLTAEARTSDGPVVKIKRADYDTFKWSVNDKIAQYQITNSPDEPTTGWQASGGATSGTEQIDGNTPKTYYVWAKDNEGRIGHSSIVSYMVTKNQGTGTVLTAKVDGQDGTTIDTNTIVVLRGTPIYVSAIAEHGYNAAILRSGSNILNANGDIVVIKDTTTIESSAHAQDTSAPNIIIARDDYDTFSWTATPGGGTITGYQITTSSTEPSLSDTGWIETGTINSGTKDILDANTYYVYVKDSNGKIGSESIGAHQITLSQGENTTLYVKADSTNGTGGASISNNTTVLTGTPIWARATASSGYNPVLKIGGITKNATGDTATIDGATTISSTAETNSYTIAFDKNNSNATGTMNNITLEYGEESTLPENTYEVTTAGVATGQVFNGWNTRADGSGISYADKATVRNLATTNGAIVTLYAQWTDANFSVSSPVKYTATLGSAISSANANATIKVLQDDITDASSASINKSLIIDLNNKTLTRSNSAITVSAGIVTLKGPGTLAKDNIRAGAVTSTGNFAFYLSSAGSIVVQDCIIRSFAHAIYTESGCTGTVSIDNSAIIGQSVATVHLEDCNLVNITNSTIVNEKRDRGALLSDSSTNRITINIDGNSVIANGTTDSYYDNSSTKAAAISLVKTDLNLKGNTNVITKYSGMAIDVTGTSSSRSVINITENASIYSQNNSCVSSAVANTKVEANTSGCMYTAATYTFDGYNKAQTFILTHGYFVSKVNKYMTRNNGIEGNPGIGTSTRQFKIVNGYDATTGKAILSTESITECYYLEKGTSTTYTISFNKNNTNATGTMSDITKTYGTDRTLPANAFVVATPGLTSNQAYVEWNTKQDGTGTSYQDKELISDLPEAENGANLILYAQWTNANYEVSSPVIYTTTLADAVEAANEGATIKVLNNNTDASAVSINKNLTLNLNGNTVTRDSTINVTGGTFTVQGTANSASVGTIYCTSGTAITNSGTASSLSVANKAQIKSAAKAIAFTNGNNTGTLTIDNSYVNTTGSADAIDITSKGNVNITDSYVFAPSGGRSALVLKGSGGIVNIGGASRLGIGTEDDEDVDGTISVYGAKTINISGTTWLTAGLYGRECIGVEEEVNDVIINCTDECCMYAGNEQGICITNRGNNTELTVDTEGQFYSPYTFIIWAGKGVEENGYLANQYKLITIIKGHWICLGDRAIYQNQKRQFELTTQRTGDIGNIEFKYVNGWNSDSGRHTIVSTSPNYYYSIDFATGGRKIYYKDGNNQEYFYEYYWKDHVIQSGWLLYDNKWYFYNKPDEEQVFPVNGTYPEYAMVTGWLIRGGHIYYLSPTDNWNGYTHGEMVKNNTYTIDGNSHKFDGYGQRKVDGGGWAIINGKWFYMDTDGVTLVSGWKQANGKWFYLYKSSENPVLNGNGPFLEYQMVTGWLKTDAYPDKWYYLAPAGFGNGYAEGEMVKNGTYTIDGESYTFDGYGQCTNP